MTKKILFFICIIFCFISHSQEVTVDTAAHKAIYNLKYQRDSTDTESVKEEHMVLLIGKEYSLFQSHNISYNDSLKKAIAENDSDISIKVNQVISLGKRNRFKFRVLKGIDNITTFDSFFSDKFVYTEKAKLNWKIHNEKMIIAGYNCNKATTTFAGRNYVAWFTEELPISDGPYKFRGLPGLITKIYDEDSHYTFELISFKNVEEPFKFDSSKAQKVSKQDFLKAYNTFKKNFIAQLYQRGISVEDSKARETQKRVQKSRNNAIELIE